MTTTYNLMPYVRPQFIAGYSLYSYTNGTTTPQATYSDNGCTVSNPNPIVMNSIGQPDSSGTPIDIFLKGTYKFVLKDGSGNTVWTADDVADYHTFNSPVLNTPTLNGSGGALTLPAGPATLVDTASTQTISGKTLQIPTIVGSFGTVTAAGTADAITATFSPVIAALTDGLRVRVQAGYANATTTPTLKADSTTAHTIVRGSDSALKKGDIPGAGYTMELEYRSAWTAWLLLNPYLGGGTSGSYVGTLSGCTTSPTVTIFYEIIGNIVFLSSAGVTATSNTTSCSITGSPPASIRPTGGVNMNNNLVKVVNNNAAVDGEATMNGSGTLILTIGLLNAFTNSGNKGINPFVMTYSLSI